MPLSIQGRPDEATGIRVIHASLDAGVSLIDSADVYCFDNSDIGHNERLIAKALKAWSGTRESVLVATKGGLTRPQGRWESDARPERLKQACEQSLKALGMERIDLYQLHAPDPDASFADSVGALADLQQQGKIRWVGLSNVSLAEIKQAESIVQVVTVQNRLNLFFRESIKRGVVRYCTKRGIGFIAYSPMGGSQLNKRLAIHPVLKNIADRHRASAHVAALAWLLAQAPNVIPIPGTRSAEHAVDSARAVELTLEIEERKAIDKAAFSSV